MKVGLERLRATLKSGTGPSVFVLLVGGLLAFGCPRATTFYEDDARGSPTTSTTSSTSTSTTSRLCTADMTELTYATEACDECVATNCCAEAEAWAAATGDTEAEAALSSLIACAFDSKLCNADCVTAVCSETWGYGFLQACDACITEHCCERLDVCDAEPTCNTCVQGDFQASCCSNTKYAAWDSCITSKCPNECGTTWSCT
jgi:hypothetical protein